MSRTKAEERSGIQYMKTKFSYIHVDSSYLDDILIEGMYLILTILPNLI